MSSSRRSFDAETENERLRSAIAENGITHPVGVDRKMQVWTRWKASSWPTILVLDSKRRVVWVSQGEPDPAELETRVVAALEEGKRAGTLAKEPLALAKPAATDTGPLAFPDSLRRARGVASDRDLRSEGRDDRAEGG